MTRWTTGIATAALDPHAAAAESPGPTPTEQTEAWQAKRNATLSDPQGWLALAGLFPLPDGEFSIGSADDSRIRFPDGTPHRLGEMTVAYATLHFDAAPGTDVRLGEALVTSLDLLDDSADDGPTRLHSGTLSWWVIERVGRRWLRLSDTAHPALVDPAPIEFFPIADQWRAPARLITDDDAPQLAVPTVLGSPILEKPAGMLTFELSGRSYQLQALDGGDGELFIIFADSTSGISTYGAGRFLWVEAVDETGTTVVDFNHAYNPPCAFTSFATCPLPPPGNRLDMAVTAGEKSWSETGH